MRSSGRQGYLAALSGRILEAHQAPAAERRLVSVLFADLVGFTALSESRDAEEVRDLLTRSFDTCRRIVSLYGGTSRSSSGTPSWRCGEFETYIDGLLERIWWHRGRCLAYGEGVTYWALAEMVRMRAGIVEGEGQRSALTKLRASMEEHVPDPEERRWVEPRLAHLLGLEERSSADREDLFSAWRLFFERLADRSPTVLVFEDIHWADAALLDFIEYLLDWSRSHPLFVLTLARPELAERRPNWGGTRSSTSLHLEPLPLEAMGDLLSGLVPGLAQELRDRVLERAAGVPLYAVETVRMLLDRGLLSLDGNEYRPTGPIETWKCPRPSRR
jgi:class 3 adenylate cyclase